MLKQLQYFVSPVVHCCSYLYKSNAPGVQDYLCNRLYGLPEAGVEKYLSQICQLVISRPFGSLERVLVGLCAKSLRIAVKVCMHSALSGHHLHLAYLTAALPSLEHRKAEVPSLLSQQSQILSPSCAGVLASFSYCAGSAQKQSGWRAAG